MHNIKRFTLASGMTCFVVLKRGYVEKQAIVSVRYGSADNRYRVGDGDPVTMPQGIAHFLEHKMFEDESINLFETFTRQGAVVNAYTSFINTAYYFNTAEQFEANLALLLHMVQKPYFTEENVAKEKGIIAQEITMYRDNPQWQSYINLHRALFRESPVRNDIAGTVEAIEAISPEQLYTCHSTFYRPERMTLICVGDLDAEAVRDLAESHTCAQSELCPAIQGLYGDEPEAAPMPYIEAHMPVSMPVFQMGFKDLPNGMQGMDMAKRIAASKILTDIMAGESADLYASLYEEGLIDNSFGVEYIGGAFYGASLFAGSSPSPEILRDRVLDAVKRLKCEGIPAERFAIIKSKHIGRFTQSLNSIDRIAAMQADLHARGMDFIMLSEAIKQLTLDDVAERLHTHLRDDNCALSVVKPA